MSTALATTVGLALYGALLVPLALAARAKWSRFVAAFYAVLTLGVAAYQTGLFQQSALTPIPSVPTRAVSLDEAQCPKIVRMMRELGLQVDRSGSATPKIVGSGADQVPEQVRQVLIHCTSDRATPLD